jgi:hypothetical protein
MLAASDGNGSCLAWSQLLQATLAGQGISGSHILQITADTSVNPGASGFLVKNWNFGKHINTGSDGIRHSDVSGDDIFLFAKGQGLPQQPCVVPGSSGILVSAPQGDDAIAGGQITTGNDGICNTTAQGTDAQLIPVGQGAPYAPCIGPGPNGVLDSSPSGADIVADGTFPNSLYPYVPGDPGFDAIDQPGVAGQGNPNPPGAFLNHFVLSYGGQIYDPSYGSGPFSSGLQHELFSFDGVEACDPNGNCQAKKKANTQEMLYTPWN